MVLTAVRRVGPIFGFELGQERLKALFPPRTRTRTLHCLVHLSLEKRLANPFHHLSALVVGRLRIRRSFREGLCIEPYPVPSGSGPYWPRMFLCFHRSFYSLAGSSKLLMSGPFLCGRGWGLLLSIQFPFLARPSMPHSLLHRLFYRSSAPFSISPDFGGEDGLSRKGEASSWGDEFHFFHFCLRYPRCFLESSH